MSFHGSLPTWFLIFIAIVVGLFVLKSLIKFAIILGATGLLIWFLWQFGLLEKLFKFAAVLEATQHWIILRST